MPATRKRRFPTRSVSPGARCERREPSSPTQRLVARAAGARRRSRSRCVGELARARSRRRGTRRASGRPTRRKICAASVDAGVRAQARLELLRAGASASDRTTPLWKTPKSARPTWIRSPAVRWTPARDREQRDDQRDADRDAGRGQRGARRPPHRFFADEPRPGHGGILSHGRTSAYCVPSPDAMEPDRDAILKALEQRHRPGAPAAGHRARHGARRRDRRRRRVA